MASLDQFKGYLIGGGARANQFRVIMNTPASLITDNNSERTSFMIKTAQLPGQTIGEIAVPFRGRNLYIAGDREFETWTTTIINDTDFKKFVQAHYQIGHKPMLDVEIDIEEE